MYKAPTKVIEIDPYSTTDYYEIQATSAPAPCNISISAAHLILDYFQSYQSNRTKIVDEWESLKADNDSYRKPSVVSYCLKVTYLFDYNPLYSIYALQKTPRINNAEFWDYVWSQNNTKLVLLENEDNDGGTSKYWPSEGLRRYRDIEVSTISAHVFCWYTIRYFFLKNLMTNETRSVTQFHFTKWPTSVEQYWTMRNEFLHYLLQFRRQFRKSFSDKGCPLLIQSDDNGNKNGCFVILDSVLSRLTNGVREINIQANVEHFRDQYPGMIKDFLNYQIIFDAISSEILQILRLG